MTNEADTEVQLTEALGAFAEALAPPDEGYRKFRNAYRRRDQRRRVLVAALITVVFVTAVLIGLWVLNHAPAAHQVMFNGTT